MQFRGNTKLYEIIKDTLLIEGSADVSRFMRLCLQHPEYGYYINAKAIGKEGDFITAPEINQIFGESVGVFLALHSDNLFNQNAINICELGPGTGVFAEDYLRAFRKLKNLNQQSVSLYLFDQNKTLISKQKQKLNKAFHINCIQSLPSEPILFIANEFFDALPVVIRQTKNKILSEAEVALQDSGQFELRFKVRAQIDNEENMITEFSPEGENILRMLCEKIRIHGGGILICDYGSFFSENRLTYRGYSNHKLTNGLTLCGESDITYNINFSRLTAIAQEEFQLSAYLLTQREFLLKMFSDERYRVLLEKICPTKKSDFTKSYEKLIAFNEMGEKFKFLWISQVNNEYYPFIG